MVKNELKLKPWLKTKEIELMSRLMIGTEQYDSAQMICDVTVAAGSELLIATINPKDRSSGVSIAEVYSTFDNYKVVPVSTTSFVHSAQEAITTALKLRDDFGINFVKLDVRNDAKQRFPNNSEVLHAARVLLNDGFEVMPMIAADPYAALSLQDLGCCALRLSAGELGTVGKGIYNQVSMKNVRDMVEIPCVGETGIRNVMEVTELFSIGMDAVLVNSAIAQAVNPVLMAKAMRLAVESALHFFEADNCATV